MKIIVWNTKGGVGKTFISIKLARMTQSIVITNESYTTLSTIIKDNNIVVLNPKDMLPRLKDDVNVVYDFGGFADMRLMKIIPYVDVIVVPTFSDILSLTMTKQVIDVLEDYMQKIILVFNRVKASRNLEDGIHYIRSYYPNIIITSLRESTLSEWIYSDKEIPSYQFHGIQSDFDNLYSKIKEVYDGIKRFTQ